MDCLTSSPSSDCVIAPEEVKKMRCLHCNEIYREAEFVGHRCTADPKAHRTKDDGIYQGAG